MRQNTRARTQVATKYIFDRMLCMEVSFKVPSLLIFVMTTNAWCNLVDQFTDILSFSILAVAITNVLWGSCDWKKTSNQGVCREPYTHSSKCRKWRTIYTLNKISGSVPATLGEFPTRSVTKFYFLKRDRCAGTPTYNYTLTDGKIERGRDRQRRK